MNESEIVEFIKKSLKIEITRLDTGYLGIALLLNDEEISHSLAEFPELDRDEY